MAKPVRIYVDRDDYQWMVKRYGNDGVRPAQCELTRRMRETIETLEEALMRCGHYEPAEESIDN